MSDGRCAQPGRAVSGGRHQAAARLQARQPRQRRHADASRRSCRIGTSRTSRPTTTRCPRRARRRYDADEPGAPALVRVGDPLRNIVPCVSCHGGIDHKLGAPWLEGMPKEYLLSAAEGLRVGRAPQRQLRRRCATWCGDDAAGDRRRRGVLCAARHAHGASLTLGSGIAVNSPVSPSRRRARR